VELVLDLLHIPNLAGTKYTGPDIYELRRIVGLRDEGWTVFSGMDEECPFAAMSGSSGNIGSTVCVMPGVHRKIRELCETGNLLKGLALQNEANAIITIMHRFGFAAALRETLSMLGFECGQPRLSDLPLQEGAQDALRTELEAAGLSRLTSM